MFISHFYLCVEVFGLHVCLSTLACAIQKRVLGPLELELQTFVISYVGAGNRTQDFQKE